MKKYTITVTSKEHATIEVIAKDDEDALKKAHEFVDMDDCDWIGDGFEYKIDDAETVEYTEEDAMNDVLRLINKRGYIILNMTDAIHVAEQNDQQVIIIDSLTHAWSGEGGALDKQGKIAARTGNSYTAWRDITPEHNRLVDAMLQSKAHIIADIRAKTDYAQVKDERGKTKVQNVGLAPVFRDGIEYEFTVCFMLDSDHVAEATKDRTALFDGKFFTITPDTGRDLYRWLDEGGPVRDEKPALQMQKVSEVEKAKAVLDSGETESSVTVDDIDRVVKARFAGLSGDNRKIAIAELKTVTGGVANYMTITDPILLKKIYDYYNKEN